MARIQGLQHINGLRGAHLSHDDPVGPHPKSRLDQIPDRHRSGAFHVGVPCLQADQIGDPPDLQFCIVFNRYDSFVFWNILR